MADIAILVAEEYERRTKKINSRKRSGGVVDDPDVGERVQLFSHVSPAVSIKEVLLHGASGFSSFDLIKNMFAVSDEKLSKFFEVTNEGAAEAARNCVFSA